MHTQDDLLLIREQLQRLTEMTYFENALRSYSSDVIRLINYLIPKIDQIPSEIVRRVHRQIWAAHQHLSGSISREIPYEVVFALTRALRDWQSNANVILTTALIDEPNFFFSQSIKWDLLRAIFPDFQQPEQALTLVQVSLPRIYRTKPLNCIPLYHELAHHFDEEHKISESTYLLTGLDDKSLGRELQIRYISEQFADLFSACYCGPACLHGLDVAGRFDEVSRTHPPREHRNDIVNRFLNGDDVSIVEHLNSVLQVRGLPKLRKRFQQLDLGPSFDDIRPHVLQNDEELHGIFSSGWTYLQDALLQRRSPWSEMRREDVTRTVNDLVEKSIRNLDVRDRWRRATMGQAENPRESPVADQRLVVAGSVT